MPPRGIAPAIPSQECKDESKGTHKGKSQVRKPEAENDERRVRKQTKRRGSEKDERREAENIRKSQEAEAKFQKTRN